MNPTELQRIATRLGNQAWTRHWLHYNRPCEDPWLMAIQVVGFTREGLRPVRVLALERLGFRETLPAFKGSIYVIERTDDEGNPFKL
jgi:hypothetical protein